MSKSLKQRTWEILDRARAETAVSDDLVTFANVYAILEIGQQIVDAINGQEITGTPEEPPLEDIPQCPKCRARGIRWITIKMLR
jgi:hypothetical protein